MKDKVYTEEEADARVREAIHPHPLSTDPAYPQATGPGKAIARNTVGTQIMVPTRHLAIEGMEDLTMAEDLILPRWRIVQYSSTIEGQPGQFNSNLDEELRNKLDLIVLKIAPSRVQFDADRNLVCMSSNGRHSSRGQSCANCPAARWGEDGEPPACSRGYTLVCLDPQDDSLCLIGALRTSVPGMKRYNSLLVKKKKSPFTFLTRFTAADKVGPKGKYFVLDIELLGENDPDKVAEYRQMYQALANVSISEVEEPSYDSDLFEEDEQSEMPF